ncbi:MAG: ribbon-helix-helix domain-containing protein [Nanoarchaeota archaeon]|nr:ribbon-helix-helix domain-containing protein [Nanoarchaeota archaeon]
MAKQKISVTLEKEMLKVIEKLLADAKFRNRSHVVEFALNKLVGEKTK